MAYDEGLAARIRAALAGSEGVTEQKMFGGIAFMVDGNMVCGVVRDDLMLRVGAERHEAALAQPHARPMDFVGRPMVGMVYVAPEGCATDASLAGWIELGLAFVRTLPPKQPGAKPPRRKAR